MNTCQTISTRALKTHLPLGPLRKTLWSTTFGPKGRQLLPCALSREAGNPPKWAESQKLENTWLNFRLREISKKRRVQLSDTPVSSQKQQSGIKKKKLNLIWAGITITGVAWGGPGTDIQSWECPRTVWIWVLNGIRSCGAENSWVSVPSMTPTL